MSPYKEEIRKQDIIDQLTWDDSVNANQVHVDVRDNTVRLTGSVSNYTAKMAAERDALQVPGVFQVENYLKIEFPPTVTIPADKEITGNISNMLAWNSRLDAGSIDVSMDAGVVTLSGRVFSYWEKYLAGKVAMSATGVVDVINNLEVRPAQSIIDMDIERDIKSTYERSTLVDEDKINVSVNEGVVHLSGVVSNQLIKQEVYDIAMYTAGVRDVIDEITIG